MVDFFLLRKEKIKILKQMFVKMLKITSNYSIIISLHT